MNLLKNKKGMTLVEVIVVLVIASILLVIMGSLILNSFSYFNKTSNANLNQQSVDSVSSFVRKQLLYASDVRVSAKAPEGSDWHTLYVQDGRLYLDEEQQFSDGFYNHNKLSLMVKGFGNYRLDMFYNYTTSENEKGSSTKDTLELLNLKVKAEEDETYRPFDNIKDEKTYLTQYYKLYYKKAIDNGDTPNPDDPTTGTVVEQMNCLTLASNRQVFRSGNYYRRGDMVYYDDFWWLMVSQTGNANREMPGTSNQCWKKIDLYFDKYSAYEYGDVIKLGDKYYICNKDVINTGETPSPDTPEGNWGSEYWDEFDKPRVSFPCNYQKKELNEDSVIYKLQNLIDAGKFTLDDIPVYDAYKNYAAVKTPSKASDFVKIADSSIGGQYRYFIKMVDLSSTEREPEPGAKVASGDKLVWQEIKVDWDENSYYTQKDTVFYFVSTNEAGYIYVKDGKTVDKAGVKILDDWNDSAAVWAKKNSLD